VEIVAGELRLRLAYRFVARDLVLHPLERAQGGTVANRDPCVARLAERAGAAVLDEQRLALGLGFAKLLFELAERRLQGGDLRTLVGDLLAEALGGPLAALLALEGRPREVVLFAIDRQLRLAQPVGGLFVVLLLLLLEHVLIRDRNRDLRLHLQQLVLHVENHLLDHLRRVLRLVDQVVQVRSDERAHAFK